MLALLASGSILGENYTHSIPRRAGYHSLVEQGTLNGDGNSSAPVACFAELVLAEECGKAILPVKVQPCEARGVFSDIQAIDLPVEPEEGYRRLAERSR